MIDSANTWSIEYQGQKFYTVQEAVDTLKTNFKDAYLNYYDDAFSQYDWSIEPSESFEELKKIRAQQLRDQYSYIRIFASYAADSGTVINTFLKHGLAIDEIVHYISKWEKELTSLEQEHYTLFIPNLKKSLINTNKVKVTIKEITSKDVYQIMKASNKNMSGIVPSRFDLAHISAGLNHKGSFIDLYGECKPSVGIYKGVFFYRFSLPIVHDIISRTGTIDFFTSWQFPKLHIKQCHLLKKAVKKHWPSYIEMSYTQPVSVKEVGKFPDGSSMESFIELCCRDFTDVTLAVPKYSDNHPIKFGLTDKENQRVAGFYRSDKQLLKDFLDYVSEYYKSNLFVVENGIRKKVFLKSKYYNLGT